MENVSEPPSGSFKIPAPAATRLPVNSIIPTELKQLETPIIYASPSPPSPIKAMRRTESNVSNVSAPGNLQQDSLQQEVKTKTSALSNGAPLPVKTESCHPNIESPQMIDFQDFEKV
jgi:hypothetical protein